MKTVSEIKDQVAKEKFDCSFTRSLSFVFGRPMLEMMDEVAKRYAEEAIKEASLVCREHYDSGCFDGEGAEANILNIIKELK